MTPHWKTQVLIGSLLVGWVGLGGPLQALEIEVSEDQVEATGVTPGGEVALLSVWRQVNSQGGTDVTLLDELLGDNDGDGRVVFELDEAAPELSVWVAVDIATTESAVTTPGRFQPRMADARFLGSSGRVELHLSRPVVVWVRPGLGAFRAHLRDGESRDADGAYNGRVEVTPRQFTRPAGRPAQVGPPETRPTPPAFVAGDVLLSLDAGSLEVVALRIPGPGEAPHSAP